MIIKKEYGITYCPNLVEGPAQYINAVIENRQGNLIVLQNKKNITELTNKGEVIRTFDDEGDSIVGIQPFENSFIKLKKNKGLYFEWNDGSIKRKKQALDLDDDSFLYFGSGDGEFFISTKRYLYIFESGSFLLKEKIHYPSELIEVVFVNKITSKKYLLTDDLSHRVLEMDINNQDNPFLKTIYGIKNSPGTGMNQLFMPMSAVLYNSKIYIAELRSHRIVVVTPSGQFCYQFGKTNYVGSSNQLFWSPNLAFAGKFGNIYCLESKAGTISILNDSNRSKNIIFGLPKVKESVLNFPRSAIYFNQRRSIIVADTGHDRILEFDVVSGKITRNINKINGISLWSPRSINETNGGFIISNSREQVVHIVDYNYNEKFKIDLKRQINNPELWIQGAIYDTDKNEIQVLLSDKIIIVTRDGTLKWSSDRYGIQINDAHQFLPYKSGLLVTNTGENRILFIDTNSKKVKVLKSNMTLKTPRTIAIYEEDIFVNDSGNCRLLNFSSETVVFGAKRGLGKKSLSNPRWISFDNHGNIICSDTDNHRIILIGDNHDND